MQSVISPNYSISDILLHLPTTKATYCLAAEEESVGSIKRQVSLKQEYQHRNGQMRIINYKYALINMLIKKYKLNLLKI